MTLFFIPRQTRPKKYKIQELKKEKKLNGNFSLFLVMQMQGIIYHIRDVNLIPGSERFPGGGHGNPLQYSFLQNPIDREAWRAIVHRIAKNQT